MIALLDVDLHGAGPVHDVAGIPDCGSILATVRWLGTPVGYLAHPPTPERGSGHQLSRAILATLGDAILRRATAQAMATTGLARRAPLADLPRDLASRPLPSLTVAVCTRDRPDDLARCLAALARLDYPDLDVLVVDNSPRDRSVETLVRSRHPHVRYIAEPCPGLNWARRRAVEASGRDVLAFVDDDVVVEPGWARALGGILGENPDVQAVTGLVMPLELSHVPQQLFERAGGLGRGFERRWLRRRRDELTASRFANTSSCGVGAAMAFRRAVFAQVGSFDPALGAGTATGGGDDLDLFFRVLRAGHTLVYEPAAAARHRHRREMEALRSQLENWCRGMLAYLERTRRAYPDEAGIIGRLAARLLTVYYPRRVLQSCFDYRPMLALALAEWRGARSGRQRYREALQQARDLATTFQRQYDDMAPERSLRVAHRQEGASPTGRAHVDLADPLPEALPNPEGHDAMEVTVTNDRRPVGTVVLVTGGHQVRRTRLADAIATAYGRALVGTDHPWRQELRHTLS